MGLAEFCITNQLLFWPMSADGEHQRRQRAHNGMMAFSITFAAL